MARRTDKSHYVELTDEFLKTWKPEFGLKRGVYVRDTKEPSLLCNASKKGTHSFGFDYRDKKVHKSRVFGFWPAMSIREARLKAAELKVKANAGMSYDDLFEITRTASHIYFIENLEGFIKIGHSTNWLSRINDLVLSTKGLRLIGVRPETSEVNENKLHDLYSRYRQAGTEYFSDQDGYIKELITQAIVYNITDNRLVELMRFQKSEIYS